MADYFTNFSFVVPLASSEQQTRALDWFRQMAAIQRGEDIPPEFPAALMSDADDCVFEAEADEQSSGLWLHSDCGGVDAVCAFVQYLLKQFNPKCVVTFEWSYDCNKPRTDAYGGGAAVITAEDVKSISTSEWLREQTKGSGG